MELLGFYSLLAGSARGIAELGRRLNGFNPEASIEEYM